jgi:hypothetical protein
MNMRVRSLIAATALATLSGTCAYAQATSQYGTWNDGAYAGGAGASMGSQINTSQMNNQANYSTLYGNIDTVAGDAAVQGSAGGNTMDITTMNNTMVNNSQTVGSGSSIASDINVGINNIGGSVGIQNQAVCNSVSVSTDPTFASTRNFQQCNAADPSQSINTTITNVAGDAAVMGSSMGNSFEADSNAPNMPIWNKQINNATVASTVNANVYNVGGSTSLSSSAIGNTGQIIHYNTN